MKSVKSPKTKLSEVKNFGPVTLPELESLGLVFVEDLQRLGFERVCRMWVEKFPERLNANAFVAVLSTIEGVVWVNATQNIRSQARSLTQVIRAELGYKVSK
jgi:hypothetical protein